jgi:hypothetical protein
MPWLNRLMFQMPISSPHSMRMFGFLAGMAARSLSVAFLWVEPQYTSDRRATVSKNCNGILPKRFMLDNQNRGLDSGPEAARQKVGRQSTHFENFDLGALRAVPVAPG